MKTTIERVCQERGLAVEDLLSGSHAWELVAARRLVAHELRVRSLSLPAIGRILHRHHTSILYLLRVPARQVKFQCARQPCTGCGNALPAERPELREVGLCDACLIRMHDAMAAEAQLQ